MRQLVMKLAAGAVFIGIVAFACHRYMSSWRQDKQVKSDLSTQEKVIAAANQTISRNDKALKSDLARVAKRKTKASTPSQILKELPQYLPLPAPIEMSSNTGLKSEPTPPTAALQNLDIPKEEPPEILFPQADLRPLSNFAIACRDCSAKLNAALQDLNAEQTKEIAMKRERDIALNAEKGGAFWHRVRSDFVWFVAGAGVGYVASHRQRTAP
jgi:hypothetical protein